MCAVDRCQWIDVVGLSWNIRPHTLGMLIMHVYNKAFCRPCTIPQQKWSFTIKKNINEKDALFCYMYQSLKPEGWVD